MPPVATPPTTSSMVLDPKQWTKAMDAFHKMVVVPSNTSDPEAYNRRDELDDAIKTLLFDVGFTFKK